MVFVFVCYFVGSILLVTSIVFAGVHIRRLLADCRVDEAGDGWENAILQTAVDVCISSTASCVDCREMLRARNSSRYVTSNHTTASAIRLSECFPCTKYMYAA